MVRQSLTGWRSAWRGAAAGLLAGLVVVGVLVLRLLDPVYDGVQDHLFAGITPSQQVTLVAIDQASSNDPNKMPPPGPWPWPNSYHAKVIANLAKLNPKAILVDIVLNRYDEHNAGDLQLVDAITGARNVVLACTPDDAPAPEYAQVARFVGDRGLELPDAANAVRGVAVRPAKTCVDGTGNAAFVDALRVADPGFDAGSIPLTDAGQMLINFSNGAKTVTCSYAVAFQGNCKASQVAGKIVVVGIKMVDADDIYSQAYGFQHDASFCPQSRPACMLESQNYGYRIMGDELTTVLERKYLHTQPPLSIGLAALLLALLVGGFSYVVPLRTAALALATTLAGYALVAIAIREAFLADPLFAPLAMALAFVLAVAARYVLEERERRKVEAMFGQYVDPNVMRQLVALRSVDELKVGGARQPISVLFCDVRGFTGLSEKLPAEEVMRLVNDFTERCTNIVFAHDGTVDKYIGDCVMAFWNAPRQQPAHADLAVRAALEIAREGAGLLARRGIGIGVGVCSGDAVIGNVGGARRKSYTAIGDVVNIASRLCSNAPGGTVLVAGSTWELLEERPDGRRLDPLKVKGRDAPVDVYSVEGSGVASPA